MFNSSVVDVGIGLILVYLILGLMCTTVNEWIAQVLKMRAGTLKEGIRMLLGAPSDDTAIRQEDINVAKLLDSLASPNDPLATLLGLDSQTIESYRAQAQANLTSVAAKLAGALNTAIQNPKLSEKIDTRRVSPETLADVLKQSAGKGLSRANHSLLREAYPEEIGGLAHAFYNHALIKSLAKPGTHPSYVPRRTFAIALTDILGSGPQPGGAAVSLDTIKASINALPESDVKRSLLTLIQNADNQLATFQKSLEIWFEDAMDRVSGWYKQKSQVVTVVVAAVLTIVANADSVQIARKLFLNPVLRDKIVQEAAAEKDQQPQGLTAQQKADLGELTGWSAEFKSFHQIQAELANKTPAEIAAAKNDDAFPGGDLLRDQNVFWRWLWNVLPTHLVGWFLTAVAASLGAPFWFDTLNKFMNIRAAGTAPNEKGQDKSKL